MKKIHKMIILIILIFSVLFVSCVKEQKVEITVELPEEIYLNVLEGNYELEDYREYGVWAINFKTSELQGKIISSERYSLKVGEVEYLIEINPFNENMYMVFLPEALGVGKIKTGKIKSGFKMTELYKRSEGNTELEKLYIEKEVQNGTNLYELKLTTYINMKKAPNGFVYKDGDTSQELLRPTYVKTAEENAYTIKRYYDARQVVATHTTVEAFNFLKARPDHETLLAFENPNRVNAVGTITEPDTRDRVRQLGSMGEITVGCTCTYNIIDNGTDSITVDLKQSNLGTEQYRNSGIYEIQIEEATISLFYETTTTGIFQTVIEYATTNNTELVKNARFTATDPSTNTDFRVKSGHEPYAQIITDSATVLKVASGTTVGQIRDWIESTDDSAQIYTFRDSSASLDDAYVFVTDSATINVLSRNGGVNNKDFEIRVNPNPFVKLEKKITPASSRDGVQPSWYDTIQQAITAGNEGSTVTCWQGEYREAVNLGTNNYVLKSTEPASATVRDGTIINAVGTNNAAVMINGAQTNKTVIEGFTITTEYTSGLAGQREHRNGYAGDPGISIEGAMTYPEIRYNRIKQNGYEYGGGIYVSNVTVLLQEPVLNIHHNIIENNEAYYGGGLYIGNYRRAIITDNEIRNNNASTAGGGIKAGTGADIMNKNGESWNENLLPGTAETVAEVEKTSETNTYTSNTINDSETAEGAIIAYNRTTAPSADNLVIHASLDWARVYGAFTAGDVARLFTDSASLTEVASVTYTFPSSARPAGGFVQIDHAIEESTEYYITLQSTGYAQSTKVASTAITGPAVPTLTSPANAESNVSLSPTLDWEIADRTVSYTVYFGVISGDPKEEKSGITDTQYATSALEKMTTYYWRIESVDAWGAIETSAERSFTTQNIPFAGGNGSEGNPYLIANDEQLNAIRGTYLGDETTSYYFEQTSNIDLNTYSNWTPIGLFYGSYDGKSYEISNLKITGNYSSRGLFGNTKNSTLTNIRISNANISGSSSIGILVGSNTGGKIINSYATGTVIGSSNNVGGLVGLNGFGGSVEKSGFDGIVEGASYVGGLVGQSNGPVSKSYSAGSVDGTSYTGGLLGLNGGIGVIENSYSTAVVSGTMQIGGFIGWNNGGSLTNCYSAGKVTGTSETGGFIGKALGTFTNCFWDTEKSGQSTSAGDETGKTTAQMKTQGTFTGWDFISTWAINANQMSYPYLRNNTQNPKPGETFAGGNGSEGSPFEVATLEQLNNIRDYRGQVKYFKQVAIIDMSSDSNWEPLGIYGDVFSSSYDGNGFRITNLTIDDDTAEDRALFGMIASNSTITNVTLENVSIIGKKFVGGLVSYSDQAYIYNCHVQGKVEATASGDCYVGLVVGQNQGAVIENCSADGFVTGDDKVGGFIGNNASGSGTIRNSYATATVEGSDGVGGFIGYNLTATIENCYSSGYVACTTGDPDISGGFAGGNTSNGVIRNSYSVAKVEYNGVAGGFCGFNNETVENCFWETTDNITVSPGGGTGKTTVQMKTQSTFTNATWEFGGGGREAIWAINDGKNDGYPYLEGNNPF